MLSTEQLLATYQPEFEAGMIELMCSPTAAMVLKALGQTPPTPAEVTEKGLGGLYANGATRSAWAGYCMALQNEWRKGRMPNDDKLRLDWLENFTTLHNYVEITYVVDGYDCSVFVADNLAGTYWGKTLREAMDKARSAHP